VFLSGVIFGSVSKISANFVMSFLTVILTTATLLIAYRAYSVWSKPIIISQLNSLSELNLQKQTKYISFHSSIMEYIVHSYDEIDLPSLTDRIFVGVSSYQNQERAIYQRGRFIIHSLGAYKLDIEVIKLGWKASHLDTEIPSCQNTSDVFKYFVELDSHYQKCQLQQELLSRAITKII
jgi:hypothetical protein